MGADDNIKTIKNVYDAFRRGDIAAILDMLGDNVDWAAETTSTVAPWLAKSTEKRRSRRFSTNLTR